MVKECNFHPHYIMVSLITGWLTVHISISCCRLLLGLRINCCDRCLFAHWWSRNAAFVLTIMIMRSANKKKNNKIRKKNLPEPGVHSSSDFSTCGDETIASLVPTIKFYLVIIGCPPRNYCCVFPTPEFIDSLNGISCGELHHVNFWSSSYNYNLKFIGLTRQGGGVSINKSRIFMTLDRLTIPLATVRQCNSNYSSAFAWIREWLNLDRWYQRMCHVTLSWMRTKVWWTDHGYKASFQQDRL